MLINSQRGHMLLLPVSVMAVLFLLGSNYLYLAINTKESILLNDERIQAYYIAEAGVEMALARLKNDTNWSVWAPEFASQVNFAGGHIDELNVTTLSTRARETTVQVTSVGVFNRAKKTIVVTAKLTKLEDETVEVTINSWREKYGPF